MLIIKDGKICIDKGDTGEFTVSIEEADGMLRPLKENDTFVLTISLKPSGAALMEITKTIGADEAGNIETTMEITAEHWSGWENAECGKYTGKIVFYPEGSDTVKYTIFPPMESERCCMVDDVNYQNVYIRP